MSRLTWRVPLAAGLAVLAVGLFGVVGVVASSDHTGRDHARTHVKSDVGTIRNSTSQFFRAMRVSVDPPGDEPHLVLVTFSAECEHSGGPAGATTVVMAQAFVQVPGGPDDCPDCSRGALVPLFPQTRRDLVFCEDSGDPADRRRVSASHQWHSIIGGTRSDVIVKYTSVGGGTAILDDMTLTVSLFEAG